MNEPETGPSDSGSTAPVSDERVDALTTGMQVTGDTSSNNDWALRRQLPNVTLLVVTVSRDVAESDISRKSLTR
jgi:hypothetical protein